ncbi:MAG TPA: 3-hydroxyacyl-CoA dehydrogenase/enoyl-CoA hydratase family protein [Ignavibacteria bacterium]|nr:3-hydroxyacyl-CoA dehydrogenase/enoyl-CoA hydratase family protein [Ignavibacteria bacterium]
MKIIKTVGIAGAGTMGSALAQKFAMEGFEVILLDTNIDFINKGLQRIKDTLTEGIEKKIFTPEKAEKILSQIHGTTQLSDLTKTELVIEAIFENFEAKAGLFKKLDSVLPKDVIIATNTSSFSVSELAKNVSYPERFIGVHYFYHAAKNRLVEIIPGKKTSNETFKSMEAFSVQSNKDAITCKDAYGFVVNRFFVPWLNEAVRLHEEGVATTGEIDAVCMKTLSIGMGPFALMNATGVPVAYHAEETLEHYGKLYEVANSLKLQAEKREDWKIDPADESNISNEKRKVINDRLLGVIFFVCSEILDEKVCSPVEINRGARIGLAWRKGPIDIMNKLGETEVRRLIYDVSVKYSEKIPLSIGKAFWNLELVTLTKKGNNAVITINRPEDMNALNEKVVKQLEEKFTVADTDPSIKTIFITGSGKAFVAGADIKFFIDNIKSNSIDNIVKFTEYCQNVYNKIDNSSKKVVSVLNGLTLGGGLELALCADVILSLPGAVLAYPETGIGIYPGLGGTQRTQKKIGKELTKYLVFTGDMLSAADALKVRLIDKIIDVNEMFELFEGVKPVDEDAKLPLSDEKYLNIQNFFSHYVFGEPGYDAGNESTAALYGKLLGRIKYKAPLAVKTAEKLIDESKGCSSELEHLSYIFSTEDALIGLSSIGKKVEYRGK